MAKAKLNKKMAPVVELPECPVCLETMSAPIFQCQSGHSLCHSCTKNFLLPVCPICRQGMTQMRNWQLEDLISKANMNCPNQPSGCKFITGSAQMGNHIKECIYRVMTCPLGIFAKCSWSGALNEILNHCKDVHPHNILIDLNQEVTVKNFSIAADDRFVYVIPQGKMIFILTFKIDVSQKLAYFLVQHIGCQKIAQQHIYDINIKSLQDNRRQVTFYDHCFSDAMDTAKIFRSAKCCIIPLHFLAHFINQKMMTFNLNIKKSQPAFTKEPNTGPQQSNPKALNKNFGKFRGKSPSLMTQAPKTNNSKNQNKNNY